MPKLFLTSSIHAVAQDIAKRTDLPKGKNLVFIDTAAEGEEGDETWLENDRQSLVDAGFDVDDYTITGKKKHELEKDLAGFDYIYLSGGNTFYLLQQSKKSGFTDAVKDLVIKKGKTYIGSSAGSIIAGPKLPEYLVQLDDPQDTDMVELEAYGFVNFTILPHWGSKDFKKRYLESRLDIAYKEDQVPLLLLTDNQYVYIQDEQMEIVDVSNK
jgi:dipeptidase E